MFDLDQIKPPLRFLTIRTLLDSFNLVPDTSMDREPPRFPVTCEIDAKAYRGTYWVAGKILTVSTGMGGKSKQVGATPPETLAKLLLQELAKEGKA